jgi:hypothetical protein
MIKAARSTKNYFVVISFLLASCEHIDYSNNEIVLDGFSDRNYVKLNNGLGARVCIRGMIFVDPIHRNVYFPLEPSEEGGVITIGISRVMSGLSIEYAVRRNMIDGQHYRVCGTLRDATPFRRCDYDRCKWYRLENAELG